MNFQAKKIRRINWAKKRKTLLSTLNDLIIKFLQFIFKLIASAFRTKHFLPIFLVFLMFSGLAYGGYKTIEFIRNFSAKDVVLSVLSQKIKTDEFNHTNFLLVGVGGDDHDGENLTDVLKIISIDHSNKYISMVSIPRDLWVKTPEFKGTKINELFALEKTQTDNEAMAIDFLAKEIEKLSGINIHYKIKIDFQSFKNAVNALGCVHIDIPEAIYDPTYPKDGTYGFDPFKINTGPQCIDGETALKYARTRHTTAGGDFSRSERQVLLIKAIKDEALSSGVLLSPTKLTKLYATFKQDVYTDLNLDELVYLAKIAPKFNSNNIMSVNINDAPYEAGGFLYAPPQGNYNGAFVFVPSYNALGKFSSAEIYNEIKIFINFFVYQSATYEAKTPLHILNGTKTPGLAGDLLYTLSRYGLKVARYGNAFEVSMENTIIYFRPSYDEQGNLIEENFLKNPLINYLQNFLPPFTVQSSVGTAYDQNNFDTKAKYIIVLGQDFVDFKSKHPELFYFWN
ncbi:MAG: cell envelope-related transcriptional attenuator [Candidatus Peregrinibacteria bacterium GW2011_GWF2_33_10]|nr:MAG: cell envelope-related transcriptional attenuator [Candidatus Peregrinibacteria bacterium GW2011_GWF2_33_10]OGJ44629.1 MAG: hypothetical protein A2263_00080 [Candidatus Peregrinibacteria bacterium RIFOXYA2_FULL_33_21]OGJ46425.1 MAG: hypothetical protein A2272_06665 [Candidatus Peregrinibacteria bacterium RIFOXYA12_FULL_33_12]OGJ50264.1 MAG: hypothetical protein A2307_01725 [Candidatus Peregrinibacteria bacterium RIFOXYB2_FULL_33_20]